MNATGHADTLFSGILIALVLVARINSVDLQVLTIYKIGINLNRRPGPLFVVYSVLVWQCTMLWSRPKNLISWSSGIIYNSKFHMLPPWPRHYPSSHQPSQSPPLMSLPGSLYRHEDMRDGHIYSGLSQPPPLRLLPPPVATSWCTGAACVPPDVFSCNENDNEELLTSLLSVPWWRASCPRLQ